MAKLTRRGFIKQTSVSAATVGALAAVPSLAHAHAAGAMHKAALSAGSLEGPLVAYVRNVAAGEVAMLIGTREIVVHDPELVMRLVNAAR